MLASLLFLVSLSTVLQCTAAQSALRSGSELSPLFNKTLHAVAEQVCWYVSDQVEHCLDEKFQQLHNDNDGDCISPAKDGSICSGRGCMLLAYSGVDSSGRAHIIRERSNYFKS
jgi:hypothetical protein